MGLDEVANMTLSVSVVIPAHNSQSTIARALQSVFAQTERPHEVIVVDDCSTDDTCSIVRSIASNAPFPVHLIVLDQNVGPSQTRNTGWNAATQDFIAFLDSDDTWHPKKLEIQHKWMTKHPEFLISGHLTSGTELEVCTEAINVRTFHLWHFLIRNRISTPTVMVRREVAERFDTSQWFAEDYELWLRILCRANNFVRLEIPLTRLYKAEFGESGLSSKLFPMYRGELSALSSIRGIRQFGIVIWSILVIWKTAKYLLRVVRTTVRRII